MPLGVLRRRPGQGKVQHRQQQLRGGDHVAGYQVSAPDPAVAVAGGNVNVGREDALHRQDVAGDACDLHGPGESGEGELVLDEEFSSTIAEFREWATSQEETLQQLFINEGKK